MACYHPRKGYLGRIVNPETGKRPIVFDVREGFYDSPVKVPCGGCVGCREDYARDWAVRCVHEASLYEKNCFITLTYDEKHLNSACTLIKSDFQDFMKRLRRRFAPLSYTSCWFNRETRRFNMERRWKPWPVRYIHCGEYGERFGRPHFHACLFNFDFPDKKFWKEKKGSKLYRSEILEDLWPFGFSSVGDVTVDSAFYVAGYIEKKITGDIAPDVYQGRQPEYATMSRRGGIGKKWFQKFYNDVFPKDFVVIEGRKFPVPKFYDGIYEGIDPVGFSVIKC